MLYQYRETYTAHTRYKTYAARKQLQKTYTTQILDAEIYASHKQAQKLMLYQYRENLYCTHRHANLIVHTTQTHVSYTAQTDAPDTENKI